MEPEIAALATSAGTTVVTLMATDAWERTRDAMTELWRRVHPGRADAVTAELEATREDLLAVQPADYEDSVNELQTEWEGRLRRLLRERPEVAGDLRRLLDELPAPETDTGTRVKQRATASGRGRVYQAGRDQHINER